MFLLMGGDAVATIAAVTLVARSNYYKTENIGTMQSTHR